MAKKKTKKKTAKKKSMTRFMTAETEKTVGYWVFLVGIFVAIIAGLLTTTIDPTVIWVLALLGLMVGFMNVTLKDGVPFLIAALVLLVAAGQLSFSLTLIPTIGEYIGTVIGSILQYVIIFVSPAAIIVALKVIYNFGR